MFYSEAVKEYSSLGNFLKTYHNAEACLDHIKQIKYPDRVFCDKCQKITNFTKIKYRPVYSCNPKGNPNFTKVCFCLAILYIKISNIQ